MSKNIDVRRETILRMVNQSGSLNFDQLRRAFPATSDVTLRKDLQYLNDTQQAIRIHGGLKSLPRALNYYYRSNVNLDRKDEIAQLAAGLIRPGESVFISAGTTCADLAKRLPDIHLSVCSDGIYTVTNISPLSSISVQLLGGDVDLEIMRVEGLTVLNQLEGMHFSTLFMGAMSADLNYGFFHNSSMTVAILLKAIEKSDRVIVLMDSSKVNFTFTPYYIPLSKVDLIVTDHLIDPAFAEAVQARGIELMGPQRGGRR